MKKAFCFFVAVLLISGHASAAVAQAIVDSLGDMRSNALFIAGMFLAAVIWVAAVKFVRKAISLPPSNSSNFGEYYGGMWRK